MKTTCFVNNYNYSQFVVEAIESALNQTVAFDEIIVVDDCSTDGSADLLRQTFGSHDRIKLILKSKNEGQLAAFNDGCAAATGDIIFFLDADDLYKPTYLEEALKIYQKHPECDFLCCPNERFGHSQGIYLPLTGTVVQPSDFQESDRDLGYSVAWTLNHIKFVGSPTSANSVKKKILDQILPIPYLQDWRIGADCCVVYGTSLAGARKFYLSQPLVKYRVHGKNNTEGNQKIATTVHRYKGKLIRGRLIQFLIRKLDLDRDIISNAAHLEFATIQHPSFQVFLSYVNLVLQARASLPRKIKRLMTITQHFLSERSQLKPAQKGNQPPEFVSTALTNR